MKKENVEEYLRRNEILAKAVGVRGGLLAILTRLKESKTVPMWLTRQVTSELQRIEPVIKELVDYRNKMRN